MLPGRELGSFGYGCIFCIYKNTQGRLNGLEINGFDIHSDNPAFGDDYDSFAGIYTYGNIILGNSTISNNILTGFSNSTEFASAIYLYNPVHYSPASSLTSGGNIIANNRMSNCYNAVCALYDLYASITVSEG